MPKNAANINDKKIKVHRPRPKGEDVVTKVRNMIQKQNLQDKIEIMTMQDFVKSTMCETLMKSESKAEVKTSKGGVVNFQDPPWDKNDLLNVIKYNVWHYRCINIKTEDSIRLGYEFNSTKDNDPSVDTERGRLMASARLTKPLKKAQLGLGTTSEASYLVIRSGNKQIAYKIVRKR